MKILIVSGWYCSDIPRNYDTYGVDEIRGAAFRRLWAQSLERALPQGMECSLLVVDSASPVSPPATLIGGLKNEVVLRLTQNPGHSQNATGHLSGWTLSVVLGLQYAEACGFDALVYVEQDVLLSAQAMSDLLATLKPDVLLFGRALRKTPKWPIQQSLFAIGSQAFRPFTAKLLALEQPDRELSPELKFCLASSPWWVVAVMHWLSRLLGRQLFKVFARNFYKLYRPYRLHGIAGGRDRPFDWKQAFYFQHASGEEIARYRLELSASRVNALHFSSSQ